MVHWLKEVPLKEATPSSLLAKGTSLGKATLAAADFLYLHEQFKKIIYQNIEVGI